MPPKKSKMMDKRNKAKYLRAKNESVSLAVKRYVNRTIHTKAENKQINTQNLFSFGNAVANPSMYCFPITPYAGYGQITQGVQSSQRIGNEVKIRKVLFKYILRPNAYNVDSNPFPAPVEVELFLGHTRVCPSEQPVAADFNVLFQSGASSFGPGGGLSDIVSAVNTDYWVVKKRWRHKIGYAGYNGSGAIASAQYFNNNDFKLNVIKKLDITKYCPKTLKFNDGNNTTTSRGLFLWLQAMSASGGTNSSTTLPAAITYWVDIIYEDM